MCFSTPRPTPLDQLADDGYHCSGLGRGIALAFAASGSAGVLFADTDGKVVVTVTTESRMISRNPDLSTIAL